MQKVSGTFTARDAATNLNLGFVPTKFTAFSAMGGTELIYYWWKALYDGVVAGRYAASKGQYGLVDAGGAKTHLATEATGIKPYDTQSNGVKIPSPSGITETCPDGFTKVLAGAASATANTISDWSAAVNYSSSGHIRSATTVGTIVRPPVHNNRVFELTTKTGLGTSEPTSWDVAIGESVTDGGSNVWLCRQEILCVVGGKGVTLGVDICTDGEIWVYEAELHVQAEDKGDADLLDPI